MQVKGGRIVCPVCGEPTDQRVLASTEARDLPVWCRHCRRRVIVQIAAMIRREP